MKNSVLLLVICIHTICTSAQSDKSTNWKNTYRESYPLVNDLIHTKLEVSFDFNSSYLYGKEWITLKPHFYRTDSLSLDAKQMDIIRVAILKNGELMSLPYVYDGWHLKIKLDKRYNATEKYTVYINYVSKPKQAKLPEDRRGLYFINPKGDQKDVPIQIWTDGETENNSVWFPTIDKPDQKSTEEMILTVPDKYLTLSNGALISQIANGNGTRTDHWKMDLPHAPYLFFIGIGDFALIRDEYKGKEVNYYVEKEYASTARKIFGLTPDMMAYFEKITGVPFPWPKYSQIVVRDFTSTAMENTTATAHGEGAQQDSRELLDGNRWENNIAHELFHQWFGDLVTCKSWSNVTLNESFARYGEYLWLEHQYGPDAASEEGYNQLRAYLSNPENGTKPLVRYYYADQEDLFDDVSYNKGGLIINMLRKAVGDSAFFQGLHLYLIKNKFKAAEVDQLRMAMEEVSGRDLNWFFNQWYLGSGHPKVEIDYLYDDLAKKVVVVLSQKRDSNHLFRIPINIDIYSGPLKQRYHVWIGDKNDSFSFPYSIKPDLINVDADKIVVWEKTDHKMLENYIFQYFHAGNYVDRREAIAACLKNQTNPLALNLLKKSLSDQYEGLREFTMRGLNFKNDTIRAVMEPILLNLVKNDLNSAVKAEAIELLANYPKKGYEKLFLTNLNDSSYVIAGASLHALSILDTLTAYREALKLATQKSKWALSNVDVVILLKYGTEDDFDLISEKYTLLSFRIRIARNFGDYLSRVQNPEKFKKGIDILVNQWENYPLFRAAIDNQVLISLMEKKQGVGQKAQADYIKDKLSKM
jgi:aminopeptidase N